MANNRSIERHFTRGAAEYQQQANVQRKAARQLAESIERLDIAPQRVLDIGCGTGFVIDEIVKRYPQAMVTGIDLSPGMLELARRELNGNRKVKLLVADAMQYTANERFDLVVCSSTLQWLQPYDQLLANLKQLITPSGWFCASAMLAGTLGELHTLRNELFPGKPVTRRLPTEQQLENALHQCGFEPFDFKLHADQETYSSAEEFFASIRAQGFTGGPLSQGPAVLTRGELLELMEVYDQRNRIGTGQVKTSYRYGIFVSKLKELKAR